MRVEHDVVTPGLFIVDFRCAGSIYGALVFKRL